MLTMFAKLFRVLNSESEPGQISMAFCLAIVMGFTPLFSLHNLIVLFLALFLRVNLTGFILAWTVISGLAYLLDPFFSWLGVTILSAAVLEGLWTALYNITLARLENFNNSVVMGSLAFSFILFFPLYFLFNFLIRRYREHVLAWVQKTRIAQMIKATKLYSAYQTLSGLRG
jgi:uncharacterized protein (TIGR03546 family)